VLLAELHFDVGFRGTRLEVEDSVAAYVACQYVG